MKYTNKKVEEIMNQAPTGTTLADMIEFWGDETLPEIIHEQFEQQSRRLVGPLADVPLKDVEIAEIESAKRIRIFTEAGDGINNTTYPTLDAAVGVVRAIYGADCHEAVTLGIITNDAGDDVATYVEE